MTNGSVTPPLPSLAYYDFYKTNGGSHVFYTEGPSLTRQEFLEECDINSLMKRYDTHVIGGPGNLPPQVPVYFDFAEAPQTLLEYMEFMKGADAAFMSLPAVVRKEFDNNAAAFVEFASDPGSLDQMRSWGLAPPAKPDAAPAPQPEPVAPTEPVKAP